MLTELSMSSPYGDGPGPGSLENAVVVAPLVDASVEVKPTGTPADCGGCCCGPALEPDATVPSEVRYSEGEKASGLLCCDNDELDSARGRLDEAVEGFFFLTGRIQAGREFELLCPFGSSTREGSNGICVTVRVGLATNKDTDRIGK